MHPNPEERHDEQEDVDEQQPVLIRASGEKGRGFSRQEQKLIGDVRTIQRTYIADCLQKMMGEQSFMRRNFPQQYKVESTDSETQRAERLRIHSLTINDRRYAFNKVIYTYLSESERGAVREYEQFERLITEEVSRMVLPFAVRRLDAGVSSTDLVIRYTLQRIVQLIQERHSIQETILMMERELQEKYNHLKYFRDPESPHAASLFRLQDAAMQRVRSERIFIPEWSEVMSVLELAEAVQRGHTLHMPLDDEQLEIVNDQMRVRLAGWENECPIDWRQDIHKLQDLELSLVDWLREFKQATKRSLPQDEHGLNALQYQAIKRFHTEGGHAGRLNASKVRAIMQRGMIVFIELEIAPGVFLPVGSVSALLPAPCSTPEKGEDLDPDFPNYDLQDVLLSPAELPIFVGQAKKRIVIVRSSIRNVLSTEQLMQEETSRQILKQLPGGKLGSQWEGLSLRRLGFAARGKDEIFHIAQRTGYEYVTYNIGRLRTPGMAHIEMGKNNPSHQHNSWNNPLAWRSCITPLAGNMAMSWMTYDGRIKDGIRAFEDIGGTLEGKGYYLPSIYRSVDQTARQIVLDAVSDRRKANA